MAAGNCRIQRGGVHLDNIGDFLTVRPPLGQRVAVKSCVFVAGVVLMLARTSPALAADNHHDHKGDNKSNAAVVQRSDSPPAKTDHEIGGGGGTGDGKGNGKTDASASGSAKASAGAGGDAKANGDSKGDKGKASSGGATTVAAKGNGNAKEAGENNADSRGDV